MEEWPIGSKERKEPDPESDFLSSVCAREIPSSYHEVQFFRHVICFELSRHASFRSRFLHSRCWHDMLRIDPPSGSGRAPTFPEPQALGL
jgi:hypothetical protein